MLSAPSCMVGSKKSRPSDSDNQVANCTIRMKTKCRSEFVFSPALFSDFHLEAKSRQNPFSLPKRELTASGQGVSFSRNLQKSCFFLGHPRGGQTRKNPVYPHSSRGLFPHTSGHVNVFASPVDHTSEHFTAVDRSSRPQCLREFHMQVLFHPILRRIHIFGAPLLSTFLFMSLTIHTGVRAFHACNAVSYLLSCRFTPSMHT